jgi:uncharacterized protein (TIGR01777 family)
MNIVITGGSGFIGTQLSKKLVSLGNTVVVVDIVPPKFTHEQLFFIKCDITTSPLPYGVLEKVDAIINLAGKSIFGKWTPALKEEIENSRIESTRHIIEGIKSSKNKPSCFICASAIGFYGDTKDTVADEQSPQGSGFLAEVVGHWEMVAREATEYGIRVVCVRTAPVLGHGGMLSQLIKTAKFGFLTKLKSQDFWMSWIHEDDIVNTYLFALETKTVQGVFNASAPEAVKHSDFMKTLGFVLKRKVVGSIPKFIAKKLFGEFFDEITKNQQVAPKRLMDKGFIFSYSTLSSALDQIFNKK